MYRDPATGENSLIGFQINKMTNRGQVETLGNLNMDILKKTCDSDEWTHWTWLRLSHKILQEHSFLKTFPEIDTVFIVGAIYIDDKYR